MAKTLLGIFTDQARADAALVDLQNHGYDVKGISVVMRDKVTGDTIIEGNAAASVADGAVSGATAGGALGALTGLLVGVGALTIPGLGAVLIGGPLALALGLTGAAATTVSAAATGAVAGGLLGALMGLGLPEETARFYEERIREGSVLLAVPVPLGQEADIRNYLTQSGAQQIHEIESK